MGISFLSFFLISYYISPSLCSAFVFNSTTGTQLVRSQAENDLVHEAQRLLFDGEYEKSRALFERVLSISEKQNDHFLRASVLNSLGILFWNLGSIEKAKSYFHSSLSEYQSLKDSINTQILFTALEILSLYNEGKEHRRTGSLNEAIDDYKEAIMLSRQIKYDAFLIKCLRQLSLVYWDLRQYRQYYSLSTEALEIAKATHNNRELAYLNNNIGTYYWKIDKYSDALKYYDISLPLALSSNNLTLYSDCLNNIGVVYVDMGNLDKALEYCLKALSNDKSTDTVSAVVIDLLNIGVIYRRRALASNSKDDFNKAIQYLNECLRMAESINDLSNALIALNNLGTIYSDQTIFVEARLHFNKALHYADLLKDNENRSMVLNNLGIIEQFLGNYESSTEYFEEAIDIAQQLGTGKVLWEAFFELGNSYAKQGKFPEALASYKDSIAIIENMRSSIHLEEYKASYLGSDKRIDVYYNAISILIKLHESTPNRGYDRLAFGYLERAKARAFLDSLEIANIDLTDSAELRLLNKEKSIMGDISKIYTKLLNPGHTGDDSSNYAIILKSLEEELEKVKQEIRETSPSYANLKYPEIITYEEIQNILPNSNTTLFAFALGKDTSLAFAITKGHLKTYQVPSRSSLQSMVAKYRKTISDSGTSDFRLGHELFVSLIQPGLFPNTEQLIIVPDDILHLLPFEALVTGPNVIHWLIDDYSISYAPSYSSLAYLMKRRSNAQKPKESFLAFGDPYYGPDEDNNKNTSLITSEDIIAFGATSAKRLTFSGLEVKQIATLFKNTKSKVCLRKEASEDRLKTIILKNYQIIHFATHAFIDDRKPARSAILLSIDQDPAEDGLLQTREIYNMKINADLVSLSGCQTGLGHFIRGEGIEGLNRAFFYAGASSVLISLWSVNDQATSKLMFDFYKHLKAGMTPIQALREAKVEMIHNRSSSHPFYWAGFIITGNVDYQVFKSFRKGRLLLSIMVILAALIIGYFSKRLGKSRLSSISIP